MGDEMPPVIAVDPPQELHGPFHAVRFRAESFIDAGTGELKGAVFDSMAEWVRAHPDACLEGMEFEYGDNTHVFARVGDVLGTIFHASWWFGAVLFYSEMPGE